MNEKILEDYRFKRTNKPGLYIKEFGDKKDFIDLRDGKIIAYAYEDGQSVQIEKITKRVKNLIKIERMKIEGKQKTLFQKVE